MKKVYLITEYYHQNQNTTGYLLGKLYETFNEQSDIDLTLIAKKDLNCPEYSNAHYINAKEPDKRSLIKRFLYELVISIKFLIKTLRVVEKGSIVFTGTTPIFLLFVLYFVKKVLNFKWVLLVHDVFPENLVPAKILKEKNFLYKTAKWLFDKIYASADEVIVIGRDMKELIFQKTNKENITIVQNWIDPSDVGIEIKQNNQILKELSWNKDDTTVFQFFGNIGRMQGVGIILNAIKKMENLHLAKFIFIGNGAYVSELKDQIQAIGSENVRYYGSLNQQEKTKGLNACDIALVTLAEGMLGLGVPSKSYFSMAADKPILAIMDQESEVADMVRTHKIGWVASPDDENKLAFILDQIVLSRHQLELNSSRAILEQYYSEQVAMDKILKIIAKIN
ncbi:glycosyltransferase family 4 protein [Acinetobacter sp. WCHA45]|uniref:glycosyltransferase family 4 protein n=1 Tax=Acinetobacter sp. WCHA45 TaxID=2004644 RepID=UPI000B3C15DA|nr:glycosyltransferase family 4 protein [Acinetobacter sp. WCHA45]AVZ86869.1 glycosyltransferase WbuB [Acinetobacter sp. WCHA45]